MEATWMQAQNEQAAEFEAARVAGENVSATHQAQAAVFCDRQPAAGADTHQDVLAGQ